MTFKDPLTGELTQELTNIGEVLTYRIVVGSTPFSAQSNVVPIAKIVVGAGGTVSSITDARPTLFRLASGGDLPTSTWSYPWPQSRSEASDTFIGADKAISSQKDWNDAIMTRLWELGGGTNWYSNTADRNVWSINTESPFTNGDYWTFNSGTGATEWKAIRFFFTDSTAGVYYNDIAGITGSPVTVADGQCVYVDLDRTSNATLTAHVASIQTVGTGTIPGSRWILAWRNGSSLYTRNWRYPIGTLFTPATNLAQGVVRLHAAVPTPADPVVLALNLANDKLSAVLGAASGSGIGFTITGTAGVGGIAGTGGDSSGGTGATGIAGFGGETETGTGGIGVVGTGGSDGGVNGNGGIGVKGIGATGVLTNGNGVWGVAGGAGASGVRGDATGNGYGVYGTSGALLFAAVYGANSGGGVGVSGSGSVGVSGSGTIAGVSGSATGTGTGVWGDTSGTGPGVKGTSNSSGAAVFGDSTGGGHGVVGTAVGAGSGGSFSASGAGNGTTGTATSGAGVSGLTTGTGHAVTGTAVGTGSGGRFTSIGLEVPAAVASSASSFAFGSELGGFGHTSVQTGQIIVDATEFVPITGASLIAPNASTDAATNWKLPRVAFVNGDRILARVKLPRNAQIYAVDALMKIEGWAGSVPETLSNPKITLSTATAGGTTETVVGSGSGLFTITFASSPGTAWATIGGLSGPSPLPSGFGSDSGWVFLDWTFGDAISANIKLGAIRVTYTYQTVDFMV